MANNQMVNFNSQDVANMYRRNQLANALQERMNAPTPVHTYQGFQAPVSPLTGISKALDMYTAKKYDDQQEDKYQAEKAAAEQKVLDENSRLEQGRENFVSNFNQPIYSETPMPDSRSSSESGIPLDQPRDDVYTSTPKTPQEKLAFALSRIGDPNQLVSTTAKGYVDQANEDIRAKAVIDKALVDRGYVTGDYSKTLADKIDADTTKNTREVDAATTKFGRDKILEGIKSSSGNAKSTEGERTSAFLSKRLENSLSQLKAAVEGDSTASSPNMLASTLKYLTNSDYFKNLANPESRQKVEAAQLDILDAALTLGTGAAYTKEQLEGYRQAFFPQLGDLEGTIKDKKERLQNVLDAARIKAGSALQKNSGNNQPIKLGEPTKKPDISENVIYGTRENGQKVIKYPDGRIVDVN